MQPHRIEVWSEKGTVRGTLAPVLDHYGVTFRVMHGFGSATAVHDVAIETQANPQPLIVFYVGDWDPSGMHMSEVDLQKRLVRYEQRGMRWKRVALTRPQIDTHLTEQMGFHAATKAKDSRYHWFVEHYGARCWELDALSPVDLRRDVEHAIKLQIVPELWERCRVIEQAECESLKAVLGNWQQAISGQEIDLRELGNIGHGRGTYAPTAPGLGTPAQCPTDGVTSNDLISSQQPFEGSSPSA
jgi:hypothetical protein